MSEYLQEAQDVLKEADLLCSEEMVDKALDKMAGEISLALSGKNPLVLCVMNGGLITTGMLLPRLGFPLNVDYIHATRYGDQIQGGKLKWKARSSQSLHGRVVLLVDDIFDEGLTLEAIVEDCWEAGAAEVYTAVLAEKERERQATMKVDFIGLMVEDRYLFGYGMDYKGYLRNAAGIYAVKE